MYSGFSSLATPYQQPGDTDAFVYITHTGQDPRANSKVEREKECIWRDKGRNPAQWETIFIMIILSLRISTPKPYSTFPLQSSISTQL